MLFARASDATHGSVWLIVVSKTYRSLSKCFDLESYLNYNRTQPDWECPICNKRAPLSELRIDEYMKEILQQIGNDDKGDTVRLDEQGQVRKND